MKGRSIALAFVLLLCFGITAMAAEYEAVIDFTYGESGWGPMGSAVFYITDEDFRSAPFSLAVIGRSQTWEGTIFAVSRVLNEGGVYNLSIWVKAMDAAPGARVWMTCVKVDLAGQAQYSRLCDPKEISTTEWVELTVDGFEYSKEGLDRVEIYLEVDDPTALYFMDDFTITGNKPIRL